MWFSIKKRRQSNAQKMQKISRLPEPTNDKQRRTENAENGDLVEIHHLFYDEN